jgi:hypothetical protein
LHIHCDWLFELISYVQFRVIIANKQSNHRSIFTHFHLPTIQNFISDIYLHFIECKWPSLTSFLSFTVQQHNQFPRKSTTCFSYASLFTFLGKIWALLSFVLTKIILIKPSSTYSRMVCLVRTPEEGFSAMKIEWMLSVITRMGNLNEIPRLNRRY